MEKKEMKYILDYLNKNLQRKQLLHQPPPIKILADPEIYTASRKKN